MSPMLRTPARGVGAAAVLGIVLWRVGTGPFLDGLRSLDARALAAAVVLTALTTVCAAWRWRLVARSLGVELAMRDAVPAYYRSQLLNTTLPGGVVGDVHRAVRHGRDAGDVGGGVRAMVWERASGQAVQIVLTLVVLIVLPSPLRSVTPLLVAALAALGALVVVVARRARAVRDAWPAITLASVLVVAGHATTFVVAARTTGSTASLRTLLPLALLVLVAMAVPLSIAGWGLREGAAAWAFAGAGLGAGQGVATAVVYGVMVLVASLPGAAVLAVELVRRRARAPRGVEAPRWSVRTPVVAVAVLATVGSVGSGGGAGD